VAPTEEVTVSSENFAIRLVSPIEDQIRYLRRKGSRLVDTLDQRMQKQRDLVVEILNRRGWSLSELLKTESEDLPDEELRLCKQSWLDCEYIDSLR
jgi:hypothetical protein